MNKCKDEKVDAYIPDKNFRSRDPRFAKQERDKAKKARRIPREDFHHDEASDEYICPQGKILKLQAKKVEVDGVIYRRYVADKKDCKDCELRGRCIRRKKAKRRMINISIGWAPGNLTKPMAEKIDTEKRRKIYDQRIAIVEPVFGNIRFQKRLYLFTLRGKIKVDIQFLLYCMFYNMGKIAAYGFT